MIIVFATCQWLFDDPVCGLVTKLTFSGRVWCQRHLLVHLLGDLVLRLTNCIMGVSAMNLIRRGRVLKSL